MSAATAPARTPCHVSARVSHRRTRPFTYEFEHRTSMWLVDAATRTQRSRAGCVRSRRSGREDHFAADDARPLTAKVRGYLDENDLAVVRDRVLMLANARSLGYVFDPLTTYFCFAADGRLEGVLAEVHNTYGERHCYPLAGRRAGRARSTRSSTSRRSSPSRAATTSAPG